MLSRLVPGPLVRWFARPYVAGDSMEAAFAVAADQLRERGLLTTLDLLGEGVREQMQVERNIRAYEHIIDSLGSDPRFADPAVRPSVSLKPSAFTTGEQQAVRAPIEALAARAKEKGVALTIDMEDNPWTDVTLALCTDLYEGGHDVGAVLQTRLHRTENDLERLPEGMRVRLVIGIYVEPEAIALTRKRPMKERLLTAAKRLLERGLKVEFGTHDVEYVERFARDVAPIAPDRCEVQMLLGVPRGDLQQRLRNGDLGPKLPVRLYVPFAIGWNDATAYLRRRMQESPSMIWLVLRNLFSRGDR
jgi:proline dehydrogenase